MKLDLVSGVLRRALDEGAPIVVEGLGTFLRTAEGYEFQIEPRPRVFVAYVHEDLAMVRRFCEALAARGCLPWIDKDQLLPGQNWPRAIERAIETCDAFVACLSPRSIVKRGQFQSELRYALDCARQMPLDQDYLIPVRLEKCTVPRQIAARVQYIDLFPDWDRGVKRIARAVRRCAQARPLIELV